jgi:addiction module RelB/DinJ family antitoxin
MSQDLTGRILFAINPEAKKEAAEILSSNGLSMSDFLRMAMYKVIEDKSIPFECDLKERVQKPRVSRRCAAVHA